MNEQHVKNLIQQTLTQQNTVNQFAVPSTPYHTHNGLDSYFLPLLSDLAMWGSGTMAAGKLDIVDLRIASTSTCLALRKGGSDSSGYQIAAAYNGANTMRIFEGSATATWSIFYLIIF